MVLHKVSTELAVSLNPISSRLCHSSQAMVKRISSSGNEVNPTLPLSFPQNLQKEPSNGHSLSTRETVTQYSENNKHQTMEEKAQQKLY